MINRIYKIINNKFSRFFKFVFFLRYIFIIFLVSTALFLIIPNLFDYKKKEQIIKNYLSQHYGLKVKNIENIKFNSFPLPNLELNNVSANFFSDEINLESKKIYIYPKLVSIYNYKNFHLNTIKLNNSVIDIDFKNLKPFYENTFKLYKRINFRNLDILISDSQARLIDLKKISFSNYGYDKDKIIGEIFNKPFKIKLLDEIYSFDFKLLNTGISTKLKFLKSDQNSKSIGTLKGKILKSNFKLDFIYDGSILEIDNFFFRDKDLSIDSNGLIIIKPFFKIDFNSQIKDINKNVINYLDIKKLLQHKSIIKVLNSKNSINFISKKFNKKLFDRYNIQTNIEYGRLDISKKFLVANSTLICDGNINLLEEYPVLNFVCSINSEDKKKLYKKIKVDYKKKNIPLEIKIKGNINILNNKINFDLIEMNDIYQASNEDLKYFKTAFENIIFDQNFLKIFNLEKLRTFIKEIS